MPTGVDGTDRRSEPLFAQLFAGDPEANRAQQIFARFKKFHKANPRIWNLFQKFAFEAINSGRSRYSSDAILHRIRWHVDIETTSDESVKINDHYSAYYARLFAVAYPKYGEFFQHRRRTSTERPAQGIDMAVCDTGTPENEAALTHELAELAHLNNPNLAR